MHTTPIAELINLSGKVAIVTGGAMGIGLGIARRLAEAGAHVVIADRNDDVGNTAVREILAAGRHASFMHTDVALEADVHALIDATVAAHGGVDILVNNAGIYPLASALTISSEDYARIMNVNLTSVVLLTQAVATAMIARGRGGKIINITSIDALHPSAVGLAVYDASKHAVWGFTKNTALELAAHNIQVNAIAPGGIATPGAGAGTQRSPEMEAIQEKFLAKIPMHRMGDADEIGTVALFLASGLSSYMTGSQIVVDGGVLLS